MKSWASVAKKAPPAPAPASASTTARQPQQQQGDIFVLHPSKIRNKKNSNGGGGAGGGAAAASPIKELTTSAPAPTPAHEPIAQEQQPAAQEQHPAAQEQQPAAQEQQPTAQEQQKQTFHKFSQIRDFSRTENSRPEHKTITRPDAPTVVPIFKNKDEEWAWDANEYRENCKYSNEIYYQEMQKWRLEKRWNVVPNMTAMTKEEEAAGFRKVYKSYIQLEEERKFIEGCPHFILPSDYGYLIPWNSAQMTETLADFLAMLFYNRADELCRCKTVEDFEKIYNEAAELQWLDWKWKIIRELPAQKALWTMSTKANMWPGKTVVPQKQPDVVKNPIDALKRTPPKYEVHGVKRGETGICNVKDLKILGKKAPIRWYVSPAYLKNLKRFRFIFEENPNPEEYDYDSDDDVLYPMRW